MTTFLMMDDDKKICQDFPLLQIKNSNKKISIKFQNFKIMAATSCQNDVYKLSSSW